MTAQILHADHLLTMDADNRIIEQGAVLIDQDGRIAATGSIAEVAGKHPAVPVRRLANRLLMPGLIKMASLLFLNTTLKTKKPQPSRWLAKGFLLIAAA